MCKDSESFFREGPAGLEPGAARLLGFWGSGFRVWGSGFGVWGLGFRV